MAARTKPGRPLVAASGIDPVVEHLRRRGIPVTRTNYLALAYPEGAPDPMPAEEEALLQEALKQAELPRSTPDKKKKT